MLSTDALHPQLQHWRTILGDHPRIGPEQPGRELWPVISGDGRDYVLKRLGPWRNLPVADEARVLAHLARSGLRVAEFLVTDDARLYSGEVEDSFVLMGGQGADGRADLSCWSHPCPSRLPPGSWSSRSQRHVVIIANMSIRHSSTRSRSAPG